MIGKILNKSLNKLHAMNSLEGLGWSIVGIYIPFYLKSIGYSWEQVFIYFIVQNTAILLASFFVAYIGRWISLQRILLIRFPLLLIFLTLLYFLEKINIPLYLVAFVDGFQSGMFWLPMHVLFSKLVKGDDVESETGKLFAIPQLVSMFGPLIGGLVAKSLGFSFLFGLGFALFVLAFIPIMMARINIPEYVFSLEEGIYLYKKYPRYFYAELLNNIAEEIEGVIWPIFVYINVLSITSVGIVGTLLAVSSALFTLVIGKLANKNNRGRFIVLGSLLMIVVWVLRYIMEGEYIFYILTIFSGIACVVFSVPYYSIFYEIGKEEKPAVFFAFREIPVWLARVIVFILALIFVDNLEILFLVASSTYLYFLIWGKRNILKRTL